MAGMTFGYDCQGFASQEPYQFTFAKSHAEASDKLNCKENESIRRTDWFKSSQAEPSESAPVNVASADPDRGQALDITG